MENEREHFLYIRATEEGYFLIGLLIIITLIACGFIGFYPKILVYSLRYKQIQDTRYKMIQIQKALHQYDLVIGEFPENIESLAINPYFPKEKSGDSKYDRWVNHGPFIASEWKSKNYLYDGTNELFQYHCLKYIDVPDPINKDETLHLCQVVNLRSSEAMGMSFIIYPRHQTKGAIKSYSVR
ncbi:MAG: hypothetical protein HQK77_03525 [Desulfobacterales bacterium]|nr:hypothetical protein [Desulfobacterales bacterium]